MIFNVNLTKSDWLVVSQENGLKKSTLGHIHQISILEKYTIENLTQKVFESDLKQKLTGFFSIVFEQSNRLYAAVDHIRSHPLFYMESNGCFYLSDNAEWLYQQVDDLQYDPIAKDEFQLTGYVTGNDTLYTNIKQLQAGELLIFESGKLFIKSYYEFDHSEPEIFDEEKLKFELHKTASKAITRLIEYANGRQIVIPLSGGYDSRLIATLLKESNYSNILTFTYGPKGNKEAAYSKLVADGLGLKWHFIEYTEELWNQAWNTSERKEYQQYSSNYVSLPHIQDWLAVKIMKNQHLIEDDAVFVPGHSGDMVAGSHIPNYIHVNLNKNFENKDLITSLLNKHYSLADFKNINTKKEVCERRISKDIVYKEIYSAKEFANEAEKWNWKNRQAKFICNSVRVYEFYGYDWWLPLWDEEFVQFFEKLPLKLRNHTWYRDYVIEIFEKATSVTDLKNGSDKKGVFHIMWRAIRKINFLKIFIKNIYYIFYKKNNEFSLNINSCREGSLIKKGYSFNGILALYYIEDLEK